jgi:hypothetical protein
MDIDEPFLDPEAEGLQLAIHKLLTANVEVTSTALSKRRQNASYIGGHVCRGQEKTVVLNATLPLSEIDAVHVSRVCKKMRTMYNTLCSLALRRAAMRGLWNSYTDIALREALNMEALGRFDSIRIRLK